MGIVIEAYHWLQDPSKRARFTGPSNEKSLQLFFAELSSKPGRSQLTQLGEHPILLRDNVGFPGFSGASVEA